MKFEHSVPSLKLADHVLLSKSGEDLLFSSDVILKFPECSPTCSEFVLSLRHGLPREEIERVIATDEDSRELFETLIKLGFLAPVDANPWKAEPFGAHFSYFAGVGLDPTRAQQAILDAHVAILGVGGTGALVLQHLVGAGVQRFTLIDQDVVEIGNLNRQFVFSHADAGRSKVEAAADYVRARLPNSLVETRRATVGSVKHIEDLQLSPPINFFVNAADHPACDVLTAVAEFCGPRHIPFLGGGCGFLDGYYGPLVTAQDAPCFLKSHHRATERAAAHGMVDEPVQPVSFAPLNTIVGALMARDIIEFLAGAHPFSIGHSVWVDLRQTRISRRKACVPGGRQ